MNDTVSSSANLVRKHKVLACPIIGNITSFSLSDVLQSLPVKLLLFPLQLVGN